MGAVWRRPTLARRQQRTGCARLPAPALSLICVPRYVSLDAALKARWALGADLPRPLVRCDVSSLRILSGGRALVGLQMCSSGAAPLNGERRSSRDAAAAHGRAAGFGRTACDSVWAVLLNLRVLDRCCPRQQHFYEWLRASLLWLTARGTSAELDCAQPLAPAREQRYMLQTVLHRLIGTCM